MDPITIDWITLLKDYGYPTVVSLFLAIALYRVNRAANSDRKECARELRTLRNYTDRSMENMRTMQNAERDTWMSTITTFTHDLTIVLNDIKNELQTSREAEGESSAEIIAHIDRIVTSRENDG